MLSKFLKTKSEKNKDKLSNDKNLSSNVQKKNTDVKTKSVGNKANIASDSSFNQANTNDSLLVSLLNPSMPEGGLSGSVTDKYVQLSRQFTVTEKEQVIRYSDLAYQFAVIILANSVGNLKHANIQASLKSFKNLNDDKRNAMFTSKLSTINAAVDNVSVRFFMESGSPLDINGYHIPQTELLFSELITSLMLRNDERTFPVGRVLGGLLSKIQLVMTMYK